MGRPGDLTVPVAGLRPYLRDVEATSEPERMR
jgi:hypothetical protein